MPPTSERLSEKEARRADLFLGEADQKVLLMLHATRFASTPQVTALLEVRQQVAQRRLSRLYRHRYLDRQIWGRRHVYYLDLLGLEYAAGVTGNPTGRPRPRPVSSYFLDHHLAVTEVYLALRRASDRSGITLSWRNELGAADHYETCSGREHKLEPDAVFTLGGPGITPVLAFLEVDRATVSWQKWGSRVHDYNTYFLSGRFQQRWPLAPRIAVLVTAPNLRRVEALRAFIEERWKARLAGSPILVGLAVQGTLSPQQVLLQRWMGPAGSSFPLIDPQEGSSGGTGRQGTAETFP